MKRILGVLQYLGIFVLTSVVLAFISLFMIFTALTQTITDRGYMLDFVSSRDAYNVVTETLPEVMQLEDDSGETVSFAETLEGSGTREFINKHFDYEFYQDASRELINGIFDWLEGETGSPQFKIALASDKEEFIDLFSDAYMLRINQLPECNNQTQIPDSPFQLECRPQGLTSNTLKSYLRQNQDDPRFEEFMQTAVFTGESLDFDQNLRENAPIVFQLVQWSPVIFLTLATVFTYLLYLLYYAPRKASNKFGKRLAISASLTGIGSLVVIFGYSSFTANLTQSETGQAVLEDVWGLLGAVAIDIAQIVGLLSLVFLAIGLLLYGFGVGFLQRRLFAKSTNNEQHE